MRIRVLGLGAAIVCSWMLAACLGHSDSERKEASAKREAKREAATVKRLNAPIEPRIQKVGPGELIAFDVPMKQHGIIYLQHCVVWRDVEFKSSSVHCSANEDLDLDSLSAKD